MNKDWSNTFKEVSSLIGKKNTFSDGINKLIEFRLELFKQIEYVVNNYPSDAFYKMPYMNVDGYHNKSIAYSIWHIFRIEDIVAHELIAKDKQVLFTNNYLELTNSPIITTGNELVKDEIGVFSKKLNIKELYNYSKAVMESTNSILLNLKYEDLKLKFNNDDKNRIIASKCVSDNELANWLIDYWCSKDILGLIKMPFSRHWIMHIEALLRIKNKLFQIA